MAVSCLVVKGGIGVDWGLGHVHGKDGGWSQSLSGASA